MIFLGGFYVRHDLKKSIHKIKSTNVFIPLFCFQEQFAFCSHFNCAFVEKALFIFGRACEKLLMAFGVHSRINVMDRYCAVFGNERLRPAGKDDLEIWIKISRLYELYFKTPKNSFQSSHKQW
jgi:hypothetical protein